MMAEAIFNGFNRKENCIYYDKKMMEYLNDKSHKDLLTGLLNKISFNEAVKEKLKDADEDVALFIIDFDNFKHVNDNYGHRIGDAVLQEFSNILKRIFKEDALIGRIGGDEFMVFMEKNVTDEIIAANCDNIEAALWNLVIGEATHFSCSIGVVIDSARQEFDSMYQHADDALYVAKAKGKACFVKWHSHEVEHTDKKVIYVITRDKRLYPMIQETYGDKYQYVEMKEAERALIDIGLYQDYLSSVFIDYDSLDMT